MKFADIPRSKSVDLAVHFLFGSLPLSSLSLLFISQPLVGALTIHSAFWQPGFLKNTTDQTDQLINCSSSKQLYSYNEMMCFLLSSGLGVLRRCGTHVTLERQDTCRCKDKNRFFAMVLHRQLWKLQNTQPSVQTVVPNHLSKKNTKFRLCFVL